MCNIKYKYLYTQATKTPIAQANKAVGRAIVIATVICRLPVFIALCCFDSCVQYLSDIVEYHLDRCNKHSIDKKTQEKRLETNRPFHIGASSSNTLAE